MKLRTVLHDLSIEEEARPGWYLRNRDRFVSELVQMEATRLHLPTASVLDAGYGMGGISARLAATGFAVTSIDADESSLQRGHARGALVRSIKASMCNLPFPDGAFDICVSAEVLEHLKDDSAGLGELARVSRGSLVLTMPAHPMLWTDSDLILLHQRRYRRRDVLAILAKHHLISRSVNPYGLLPGLAILFYKRIIHTETLSRRRSAGMHGTPLAMRFCAPPWVDGLLSGVFRAELKLSMKGLIPWGHAWWVIATKNNEAKE